MQVKMSNILLFGAAAYVAMLLRNSSKDTLKANAMRVQVLDIDVDWQRIRLTLNVQNPTSGNIVLRAIYGDLFVNGTKVANVSYSGYTSIPAASSNYFNIEGRFIAQNMGPLLNDLVAGRKRYDLVFHGSANINSELVPFNLQVAMNG